MPGSSGHPPPSSHAATIVSAPRPHHPPQQPPPDGPGDDLEPDAPPRPPAAEGPDLSALYEIRPYNDGDGPHCKSLYSQGLLGGKLAPNDTGIDIDDIRSAYLLDPHSGFWVAHLRPQADPALATWLGPEDKPGMVVGMVGVQHHEEGIGEIRRLRVHPRHRRRGIGSRLLETAIRFCRDSGCLKVQLDTYVAPEAALRLFERFRFRHGRTRKVGSKDLLYFYLDLYTQPPK